MANPTGWTTPETAWLTTDGILNTDLNRIENNILILKDLLYTYRGTFEAKVSATYFSGAVTTTWTYEIVNRMVYISIPTGVESPATTTNLELQVEPVDGGGNPTTWPANIVPSADTIVPCVFKINTHADYNIRPGYMLIPSNAASNIVCYITKYRNNYDDGYYQDDGFYESSGSILTKAIPKQTVSYMVDSFPSATTTTTTSAP